MTRIFCPEAILPAGSAEPDDVAVFVPGKRMSEKAVCSCQL